MDNPTKQMLEAKGRFEFYQTKLRNWGLEGKEKYYYLRYGESNHGIATGGTATVCIIPIDNPKAIFGTVYTRGVSFCNPTNQFCHIIGRSYALGRAIKAKEIYRDSDPIPAKTPAGILTYIKGWEFLSVWDATLTPWIEEKLFKGAKEGVVS